MEGDADEHASRVNVAPIISDEKAKFVARQLASTLLGGVRLAPGMAWRAHALQAIVWALPVAPAVVVSITLADEARATRVVVAGTAAAACVLATNVFRWLVCNVIGGPSRTPVHSLWFTDYDGVDYGSLLTPDTCRALLPPKQTYLDEVLCVVFSFALMGCAAGVLDTGNVKADLGGEMGGWLAPLLSAKCFVTVATAQYGLTGRLPVEAASHRYNEPLTLVGFLADYSRPLVVIALLSPCLFHGGIAAAWLRVAVASLSALWAFGVLPQLNTLGPWLLDQVEVHLFGGTSVPRELPSLAAVMASSIGVAAVAVSCQAASDAASESSDIMAIVAGLPVAGILAAMPHRVVDMRGRLLRRLGLILVQVAVGAGAALGLILGLGSDVVRDSLRANREMDAAWAIRLVLEQVAMLLCLVGKTIVAKKGLRLFHFRNCIRGPESSKGRGSAKHTRSVARVVTLYSLLEAISRVALFVHAACFGAVAVGASATGINGVHLVLEVVLLLRAFRVAAVHVVRGATDAWVAGVLDLLLTAFGSEAPLRLSLGSRLLLVSLVGQRLEALAMRTRFAAHLTWVTWKIPKLRHPITKRVLFANLGLLPLLVLVIVLSAILESPLVALFTLPCFTVGYPRPRHGHPELRPDGEPLVKGVEGLFYSLLTPSLLSGLATRWRCGALSSHPGAMILCRSHERLICIVRVLSAGVGWVNVELRGLELQEPTSCHHVEAGRIDDAFALAFEGTVAPRLIPSGGLRSAHGSETGLVRSSERADGSDAAGAAPPLFVLDPVCETTASTYEQTQLSMAGILDNVDTLRQVHQLFLKALLWVFTQRRSAGSFPRTWVSGPLKARDAHAVRNLLRATTWSEHVSRIIAMRHEEDEHSVEDPNERPPMATLVVGRPGDAMSDSGASIESMMDGRNVAKSPREATFPRDTSAEHSRVQRVETYGRNSPEVVELPEFPKPRAGAAEPPEPALAWGRPGSLSRHSLPPCKPPARLAAHELPGAIVLEAERPSPPPGSPPNRTRTPPRTSTQQCCLGADKVAQVPSSEDLDELMNYVMNITPARQKSVSDVHRDAAVNEDRQHSDSSAKTALPSETSSMAKQRISEPRSVVPVSPRRLHDDPVRSKPGMLATGETPVGSDELDHVTRLVIQAYTAVNIAPTCGQSPEALGPAHILKAFNGVLAKGCQAPEVLFLEEHPELLELVLRAFRYAVKVTVDCVAMAEDALGLADEDLEERLRELDKDWCLGLEGSPAWQDAMQRRQAHLMSLRRAGTTEYQLLRLSLREDTVRVGELRSEVVQSIWAAASLELRYFTNDDDERYSIQAHPTLLRNLVVQCAEYPIFVSSPTTVWL